MQEQTLRAWLLEAHCLGSNADAFRHSTPALCRGTRAAEQPWREGAMWVAWGGKRRQILDMETNPGQHMNPTQRFWWVRT